MLESAVVSQIAVMDLTHVADLIQSRNYRTFEAYFVVAIIYLAMAICLRRLTGPGRPAACLPGGRDDRTRPLTDILSFLLLATRWTLALSAIAFLGGGIGALLLLFSAMPDPRFGGKLMHLMASCSRARPFLLCNCS